MLLFCVSSTVHEMLFRAKEAGFDLLERWDTDVTLPIIALCCRARCMATCLHWNSGYIVNITLYIGWVSVGREA
jgi:hypothetical protein